MSGFPPPDEPRRPSHWIRRLAISAAIPALVALGFPAARTPYVTVGHQVGGYRLADPQVSRSVDGDTLRFHAYFAGRDSLVVLTGAHDCIDECLGQAQPGDSLEIWEYDTRSVIGNSLGRKLHGELLQPVIEYRFYFDQTQPFIPEMPEEKKPEVQPC